MKRFIVTGMLLFCLVGLIHAGSKTTPNANNYMWDGNTWERFLSESEAWDNLRIVIFEGDNFAYVEQISYDDVSVSTWALDTIAFNYGYNVADNNWDRLTINELAELIVRCSTQSTVKIIDNDQNVTEVEYPGVQLSSGNYCLDTNDHLYGFGVNYWERLRAHDGSTDDRDIGWMGLLTQSYLYGYYDTNQEWDRLTVNELAELIVRCSTQSTVKIIDTDVDTAEVELPGVQISSENYCLDTNSHLYGFGTTAWDRLRSINGSASDRDADWMGLLVQSFLYGYDVTNTNWDRLTVNELAELIVRTSTQSTIKIIDNDVDTAEVELPGVNISSENYALDGNSFNYGFGTTAWNRIRAYDGSADDVATDLMGLAVQSSLFGFDGTNWDRVRVDEHGHLWVRTSTNSVMQARNYFWDGDSWERGVSNELQQQIVETSTKSHTIIIDSSQQELDIDSGANDDEAAAQLGAVTNARLYGFNGTAWDRLISDAFHTLWVRTSTLSVIGIIDSDEDLAEVDTGANDNEVATQEGLVTNSRLYGFDGTAWDRARIDPDGRLYVISVTTWFPYLEPVDLQGVSTGVPVYFEVRDSTYVCRNFYANGSLTVNFNVKHIAAYSQGGTTQLSWDSGDNVPIWDGVPFTDVPIDETFDEAVPFTFTLAVPTTFTLYIRGIPTNP